MPLFQTSVLKNYLSQQDNVAIEQAYLKYSTYFLNLEIQQNISDSKEEQFQATFLTELFVNVLGYTINPSPKYNLTTEFKNEKGAKKAMIFQWKMLVLFKNESECWFYYEGVGVPLTPPISSPKKFCKKS